MALEAQNNPYPSVLFRETVDPANPDAGDQRLFVDTDHLLKMIDSSGTVTTFSTSAGAVATDAIWDAAGDLAVGSGANTAARLAAGSDRRVLQIASGTPAWGLPHAWGCIISGTSTALSTGAYTSLSFGSADTYDPDGYHDPSGSPTLITIPSGLGGIYHLTIQATWPSGSSNDRRLAYRINGGSEAGAARWNWAITSVTNNHIFSETIMTVLADGDTVECRMLTNLAGTTTSVYFASLFMIGVA